MKNTTMIASAGLLLIAAAAHADETACLAGLERAAGKYASCQAKGKATYLKDYTAKAQGVFWTCNAQYAGAWEKLKAKNPDTTCGAARFEDNGDGTVTDHHTGLVWEQTDDLGGIHDKDNTYSWTNGDADQTDEDGTVFTAFLASLNAGAGFAGANGWRLPTIGELQSILYNRCAGGACIDPIFGPAVGPDYWFWSATTSAGDPSIAWVVGMYNGIVGGNALKTTSFFVRAVRSGS